MFLSALAVLVSAAALSGSQQLPPSPDAVDLNLPQPEWVKLYSAERDLIEPILLQSSRTFQSSCREAKADGNVKLSFVIDTDGLPRNVVFDQALANEIDLLALKVLLDSKFQPATYNGKPVAVGRTVEMHVQICANQTTDQSGKIITTYRLRSYPAEKFKVWHHSPAQVNLAPIEIPSGVMADHLKMDNHFSPPVALIQPPPPDAKGRSGKFSFKVLVDVHGIPQDIEVLSSSDSTLLPRVAACIRGTRYRPALKDGMPLPAHLTEEVDIVAQH
jgi:hypothetical protein